MGVLTQLRVWVRGECVLSVLLYAPVSGASVRVVPSKVEVSMEKVAQGQMWPALGRAAGAAAPAAAPATPADAPAASAPAPMAPRVRSKWDALDLSEADDAPPAGSGDAELNAFFRKLYADADPDTRRAMVKSFQESGGTALSTNWAEVGKQRVAVRAPSGMEARKYEQ